jgi:hypothetical protein
VSLPSGREGMPSEKPLTGEGMFIIDQFQTTLEDGTLHMSDEQSVSNISPSMLRQGESR